MKLNRIISSAAIAAALLLTACVPHYRFEHNFFFNQPRATAIERLRRLPLEDQYRLFRYAHDQIEPPLFAPADPIAERGVEAIPFLTEKLKNSEDSITIRDIFLVLSQMQRKQIYNVRGNALLMSLAEEKFRTTIGQPWEYSCRVYLDEIKGFSGP